MTPLQKYILVNGIDSLKELGINVYLHPTLPLNGFKYNQIESPKTHEVVKWSRGTVLERDTWKLVAQPFKRFFNYGEGGEDDIKAFDWSQCTAMTKEDGSLIIVYFYSGEWHVNTSGSFGLMNYDQLKSETWRDLFWRTFNSLGGKKEKLQKGLTYIMELCTLENKVVRHYKVPSLFLLSVMNGEKEFTAAQITEHASLINIQTPQIHLFKNIEEVEAFILNVAKTDATFEGIVIRDKNNLRFKVKSASYLAIHRLFDNGGVHRVSRLIELVMANDGDEFLLHFPELSKEYEKVRQTINSDLVALKTIWDMNRNILVQKNFALAIKDCKYSSILFCARKTGKSVDEIWRGSTELIVKRWNS